MSSRLIHLTTVVLALGSIVSAADIQWTDFGADHLWGNPENWDLGRVPTLEDDVRIDVPAAAEPNGPVIQDGIAADDGGAVRYNPDRSELTVTNCAFIGNGKDADGNAVGDDHGAWSTGDDDAGPMTFSNCLFADNASVDDRVVEVRAAFAFLNCTFIGNVAGDEAILAIRGRDWDSTGDGEDDMTTDDSIIANCLFINNTMLSNRQIIGDTRNDVFAPTVSNCLFFGNLDQNGELAQNTDGNSTEAGTIDVSAVTDATEIVVDPLGDYHLVAGSPAIDASDPATATEADIEGTTAVGIRDVGAYEFVGP